MGLSRAKQGQMVPNGAKQGQIGPNGVKRGQKGQKRALRGQGGPKGPTGPNEAKCSLEGLTHRLSYLPTGDHIDAPAITSCPVPDLAN